MTDQSALVLFSGGQDSTTCLAWALQRYRHVETIGFRYNQRHSVELDVREAIRGGLLELNEEWARRLGPDHLLDLSVLGNISQTALTSGCDIGTASNGLPNTFVPGRNLLFLTLSASVALPRGIRRLITGVCETDYSGYPDCRDDTMKALQVAINLGMNLRFVIETPLMWLSKAETWDLARRIGGKKLVELVRDETHTCYLGDRSVSNVWGKGCGSCPACELRAAGWFSYMNSQLRV